jgi:hypothetical protein
MVAETIPVPHDTAGTSWKAMRWALLLEDRLRRDECVANLIPEVESYE